MLAEGAARAAAAAEAPAAPRPRVVLLGATLDDPLSGRIAAELEAMGLDVTRLVIATAVPIEDQVRQAFVSGARAAVVADGHRTETVKRASSRRGSPIRCEAGRLRERRGLRHRMHAGDAQFQGKPDRS